MRRSFTVPISELGKPGGPKIYMHPDNTLLCSYDHPPRPSRGEAQDAMPSNMRPRGARDQEEAATRSERIHAFLKSWLDPEDYERLWMIGDEEEDAGDYEDYTDGNEALTDQLESERFQMREYQGASDSAYRRHQPMTSQEQRGFNARYPYFDRLKFAGP